MNEAYFLSGAAKTDLSKAEYLAGQARQEIERAKGAMLDEARVQQQCERCRYYEEKIAAMKATYVPKPK